MVSAQAPARDRSLGDAAVERALRTIVLRKLPDVTAQLAALPNTVGYLEGFRASAVAAETLRLTEEFRAVDPLFIQPRVFAVPIAGPKPGIALEAFSKHLLAGSDATVKPLETKFILDAGVDWVRSEALSTDSVLGRADYVVEMVRAWPSGALRVRGEMPGEAGDSRFAARLQALALSIKPKAK